MDSSTNRNGIFRRTTGYYLVVIGLLLGVMSPARAQHPTLEWNWSPEFNVTGIGKYRQTGNVTTSYQMLATSGELKLSSPARPYHGGLFAEYRLTGSSSVDDQANLGAYIRYDLPLWDFTGYLFNHRSVGSSGVGMYAGRVRYRFQGDNKVGVEYMRTLQNSTYSEYSIAYYGAVSNTLSFNVALGRAISAGPDLEARVELSWQVH